MASRSQEALSGAKELGVSLELFNGSGKAAWRFLNEYRKEHGELPGPSIITENTGLPVRPLNLDDDPVTMSYLVDRLHERHIFKGLTYGLGKANEGIEKGEQDEAVAEVLKLADFLRKERGSQVRIHSLAEIAPEVKSQYEMTKSGVIGIPYPWDAMNAMTLGMWPGTLTFFVARPGVGKTWTAMMTAMHVWANEDGVENRGENRRRVLVVEPEMSRVELAERLVAYHGKIPYGDLVSGTLGIFLEKRLDQTIDNLTEIAEDFFILDDEERLNAEGIEWALDATQAELLVIDSIYMMRVENGKVKGKGPGGGGSKGGRYDRILETVDWARSLSRRKKIPVLGVSQLNRDGKVKKSAIQAVKAGKGTGGLEDALAMTDTLLWDVHNLFAVWQDEDMIVDKQLMFIPLKVRRRAKISGLVINWDMVKMDFNEIGTKIDTDDDDGGGDGGGGYNDPFDDSDSPF